MNISFITYQTEKLRLQRIIVKTTCKSDLPWSAIFSVIVYGVARKVASRLQRVKPRLHIVVMIVSTLANMFPTVPSNFDTREHFDYNIIKNFTSIVINCSVFSGCNGRSHPDMSPALSQAVRQI